MISVSGRFNQTVDHYGFTTEAKFQQKYLYNDEWYENKDHFVKDSWKLGVLMTLVFCQKHRWDKQGGPIFFYAGNEGIIEAFAENRLENGNDVSPCNNLSCSGFMWDIAPEFNALLVFAEHRFHS